MSSIRESALLYREGIIAVCAPGLSVLPVTITKNRRSVMIFFELMDQLRPDYYISGQMIPDGNDNIFVQIEIVRVKGYHLPQP